MAFGLTLVGFATLLVVILLALQGRGVTPAQAASSNRLPPGVSRAQNKPAAAPVQAAGPGMYDDADPGFAYSGVWYQGNLYPDAYQSTMHFSNDANARVSFSFQGTGFTLYRVTYTNRGLMDIYIDGALNRSVNNYSDAAAWQVPLTINDLPDGAHTVEFRNTSEKFYLDIDALQVHRGAPTAPQAAPTRGSGNQSAPPVIQPQVIQPQASPPTNTPTSSPTNTAAPVTVTGPVNIKQLIYGGSDLGVVTSNLFSVNPFPNDPPVQISNATTPPGFDFPVWSPDGIRIAFRDSAGYLAILNKNTGVITYPSGPSPYMRISPAAPIAWDPNNPNRIAFVDAFGANPLVVLDFSTISAKILEPSVGAGPISWSKALNGITYQTITGYSQPTLLTVDAGCATPVCTPASTLDNGSIGARNTDPGWNPAGDRLAYISNRNGQTGTGGDLYVYNATTQASTRLTTDGRAKATPTWSSDGTEIAFIDLSPGGDIRIINLTTATLFTVRSFSGSAGATSLSWSPNPTLLPTFTPTNVFTSTATSTATNTPGASPTATNTSTPSITPSNTATFTPPPPPSATLTVNNTTPAVGSLITFTLTVNSGGFALNGVLGALMINGSQMLIPTPNTPVNMAPNTSQIFTFQYTVTQNDLCDLRPVPSVSFTSSTPTLNGPITVQYGSAITVQRLGLTVVGGPTIISPQPSTSVTVGATVTTQTTLLGGCVAETITATSSKSGDTFTFSTGTGFVGPGQQVIVTSTHVVTAADAPTLQISYTFNANGTSNTGVPLTPISITVAAPSITVTTTTTGTPGSGSGLTIAKAASTQSTAPGKDITFTITVTNTTAAAIPNVTVTDNVPTDTLTVKSVTTTVGAATTTGNSITAALGTLNAGQVATITVNATVNAGVKSPAVITNSASVSFPGGAAVTSNTVSVPLATGGAVLPTTGYGSNGLDSMTVLLIGLGVVMVCGVAAGFFVRARGRR